MTLTRRTVLIAAGLMALPAVAQATPVVHVRKDPNCGCCTDWITVMQRAGFTVTAQDTPNAQLADFKTANGITPDLASCHTATVSGYMIEGHVPPADIRRLLDDRPDAVGLSVPGMPYGSPGMGPETEREAYDVILIGKDGNHRIFAQYAAA